MGFVSVKDLTPASLIWSNLVILIVYIVSLGIYRSYFSPLAAIPGPKLAALTQWYETYYELFKAPGGQFMFHFSELHKKYGPIVRISPREVHIQDSEFFHIFYSTSRPWDKPKYLRQRMGNDKGIFSTPDHETHRHRRTALNQFFSKRRIFEFSPLMQQRMTKLCDRLDLEYKNTGKVVRLDWMFACFGADVVVSYCFQNVYEWLEAPDFRCGYAEAVNSKMETVHLVTQFPWLAILLRSLPDRILSALNHNMKVTNDFNSEMFRQVKQELNNPNLENKESRRMTVFKTLLDSQLPPEEISPTRLQDEAASIVGAGVETTRWALSVACFHILNTPPILRKLRAGLEEAIPDPDNMPSLYLLEQIPYLSACIEEACRMSYGSAQRSPRISNHMALAYGKYILPPGTVISMDIYSVSHDEKIFPDSHTFAPERWLDAPRAPDGKLLSAYMVSFGRGTRACIGMQLALAQMYIAMANIFRKFEFDLYETDRTAVDCVSEKIVPRPKPGTLGVRVTVR